MNCIGSKDDKIIHLDKCIHSSKIKNPVKFETLEEAFKQGFTLSSCCNDMRNRLFNKGFVIKGPKANTVFHSKKYYYPEGEVPIK